MKIYGILFFLFSVCHFSAEAQQLPDSIHIKKVFGGIHFYDGAHRLSAAQLNEALRSSPEAMRAITRSRSNEVWALLFGGTGGALVGYTMGFAFAGVPINFNLLAAGSTLLLLAIPIGNSTLQNAREAVEIYNKERRKSMRLTQDDPDATER